MRSTIHHTRKVEVYTYIAGGDDAHASPFNAQQVARLPFRIETLLTLRGGGVVWRFGMRFLVLAVRSLDWRCSVCVDKTKHHTCSVQKESYSTIEKEVT